MKKNYSTLILTLENKPGVLYRISGVIRKRRFNVFSVTASPTNDPKVTTFTVVVEATGTMLTKIARQLDKLIEVINVQEVKESDIVARELALFKMNIGHLNNLKSIEQTVKKHHGVILSQDTTHMIVEKTGTEDEIDAFKKIMDKFGNAEYVRTGRTAIKK